MKYTSLHGDIIRELYGPVEESLYADLVAALEIARAYQAKCERLETENRLLLTCIATSRESVS